MYAVEFRQVRFTYDGQRFALDGVDLALEKGSFTCILGGNGSGKSTLARHVNALLLPDSGTVSTLGHSTADPDCTYLVRSGAGLVFQNPDDQLVASIIEDDVAFGPENLGVPADELRGRVERALAAVGLQGFQKKQTSALSGGQKQRVAIAGVLAMEPEVLVLDEATAMLDPRGRAGLLRICRELNAQGLTIVLITHFMEEAAQADRVVVLDAGRVAADGTPEQVLAQADVLAGLALEVPFAVEMSRALQERGVAVGVHVDDVALAEELAALAGAAGLAGLAGPVAAAGPGGVPPMAQREGESEGQDESEGAAAGIADQAALITFQDVSFTYETDKRRLKRAASAAAAGAADALQADWGRSPEEFWAVQDVSFSLRAGEFLGVAGHTGSGKSTLIQLANGLLAPTRGRVLVNGRDIASKKAAAEARRNVGVVFQYPENQLFAATVFDDVAFGPRNLGLGEEEVEARVRAALDAVHLPYDQVAQQSPFALSGGQQRRVAFAGVLAMEPGTLILDEPAAGLDPQGRASFLELICELRAQRGLTVVLVSHSMDDLARLCDRVLVLNRGRVFALAAPRVLFAQDQAERLRAIGLGVPHAVSLARSLRARGVPVADPVDPFEVASVADAVAAALELGAADGGAAGDGLGAGGDGAAGQGAR